MSQPSHHYVRKAIGIRECWQARGRGAFLMTHYLGYTQGCVLAPLANVSRISPNMVSVLSFLTVLVAVVPVAMGVFGNKVVEGIYLSVVLLLSYGWDCADGVLARVTGRCSSFGLLWDKIVDLMSLFAIAVALGLGAEASPHQSLHDSLVIDWPGLFSLLLLWSIVPRTLLSVFGWLKDMQLTGMSRKVKKERNGMADILRRTVGNFVDEPVYRIGIGLSWAAGCYWEFVLFFHGIVILVFVMYVADTWRKLALRRD